MEGTPSERRGREEEKKMKKKKKTEKRRRRRRRKKEEEEEEEEENTTSISFPVLYNGAAAHLMCLGALWNTSKPFRCLWLLVSRLKSQ